MKDANVQIPQKLFFKHLIRKAFLEDWALKLIALVITFGLWFGVTGLSTPTTKRLTVPLNLNISSNAQIVNVPRQEVEIEISGDKRKMEQINRSELIASVDLTDIPPGDRVVTLTPDDVYVPLPQGIKLVDVTPGVIAVNLEAVQEKEMKVVVKMTGKPAAGFEVYNDPPAAMPPLIRVRGPASVVKILESIETDPIDLTGKKEGFTARQVPVNASDPKAAVLNTVVDVTFRIGEVRTERAFTAPIPGLPGKTVSFSVYGPRTALQKARPEAFKIEMVLNENGEEVPQVTLPAELADLSEVRKVTVK